MTVGMISAKICKRTMCAKLQSGAWERRWRSAVRFAVAAFVALVLSTPTHADDEKLKALGKRLAGECTSCHRPEARGGSIPSITGWKVDEFVATMAFYAKGERPHQAMMSVAQSLDESQTRALALYFGALPKPPRGEAK